MSLDLVEHHVTMFHQLNDTVLVELNTLINDFCFEPTSNEISMKLVRFVHTLLNTRN